MPTSTNVTNLKINELTEAQYDTAVQQGIIGANELSVLTDAEAGQVIQVTTMPTAAAGELDKIYQFIGTTDANYTNGYFYKCVSDGQEPATYSWTQTDVQPSSGGQIIQYDTMPTGSAELDGKIIQYTGTNSGNYVRGQFYRYNYAINVWSELPVAPRYTTTSGGSVGIGTNMIVSSGSGYTVYSDETIAIGTVVSGGRVSRDGVAIGYNINNEGGGVCVGYLSKVLGTSYSGIAIGSSAKVNTGCNSGMAIGPYAELSANSGSAIAIGSGAKVSAAGAIQIGTGTNSGANTLQVKTYSLLDANGDIPTDRFTTTPVADGTYVPTLTISSGTATRTWGAAASAPVVPATMPTLAVADWSSNTQTVNVTGVTASNIVFVSPAPASAADYAAAGIVCTAQGSGTLTFTCTTVPTNAITVNVVILG